MDIMGEIVPARIVHGKSGMQTHPPRRTHLRRIRLRFLRRFRLQYAAYGQNHFSRSSRHGNRVEIFGGSGLDVSTIDWVVLTHAHLDHTGWLPCLVRDGYRGPIFADPATIELVNILLPDSAHIMEEDALDDARRGKSRHNPPLPLYTHQQVAPMLAALKPIPRSGPSAISPPCACATPATSSVPPISS
jgi:hypothetical protein